jgi:hypothetical protein
MFTFSAGNSGCNHCKLNKYYTFDWKQNFSLDWIHMAQKRGRWQALVHTVMGRGYPYYPRVLSASQEGFCSMQLHDYEVKCYCTIPRSVDEGKSLSCARKWQQLGNRSKAIVMRNRAQILGRQYSTRRSLENHNVAQRIKFADNNMYDNNKPQICVLFCPKQI